MTNRVVSSYNEDSLERGNKETSRDAVLKTWYNEKEFKRYHRYVDKGDFNALKRLCKCTKFQECPACQLIRVRGKYGGMTYCIDSVKLLDNDSIIVVIGDKEDPDYKEKVKLDGNKLMKLLQRQNK